MKKAFLFVLSCFIITVLYSQNTVKQHSTVSGGILGAVNATEFKVQGTNPTNVDYNLEAGWSVGGWLNFSLANRFSIEPQLMYSSYGYHANSSSPLLLNDGRARFISVPLLLKFHAGDKIAITAGPQIDFFSSFEDDNHSAARQDDDFKQTSFSIFGGLELFPRGPVTIFGRYIHGMSDMDVTGTYGENVNYRNQVIQAGLKLRLFGGGKKEPAYQATSAPLPVADTDGDGINDDVDKCPNEPGTAKYNGCPIPDTDKDGINDELDKCPNQAGTAKYNGCPIPDTDGDGINDEEDKCPNQAGPANRNGCPITDRDNDGINDEEDKCPDVPGVAANKGCPAIPAEISKLLSASAQKVSFTAGSSKLSLTSNTSLNQVVKVMNENPTMKLRIEGHTDNTEKNAEALGESRANAVKTYLVSKGISADRIEVQGFGSTMPIADNDTMNGKAKNRRVEIKVVY